MKTFDFDLKPGPVILGVLMMLLILAVMFFSLHVHRVRNLYQVDFTPCTQYRTFIEYSQCMTLKVHEFLLHPQWRAAQFACYMLAMIIGGIFCAWYAGSQRLVAVPLIALMTGLLAAVLFNPGGLISLAGLLGVPLGGAIFQVFSRNPARTNSA